MNKKMNPSDYILSLALMLSLVCIAGAFFFGVRIGQDRAEKKYAAYAASEAAYELPGAYDQQHLVSFYHRVYAPYREFADVWFQEWGLYEASSDASRSAKPLSRLHKAANDTYALLSEAVTPENSPLLGEAHRNLLRSLKLFADTSSSSGSEARPVAIGGKARDSDDSLAEGQRLALLGQQQYYAAIVKWNETIESKIGSELLAQSSFALQDWSRMSLNVKNAAVASILLDQRQFLPLYPQDMTVRIDEWIANGQTARLSLNDVGAVVEQLASMNAARKGDFLERKSKWYRDATLPMLPVFFQDR